MPWNSNKDGVSQAGCVYPPATVGHAASPKYPCEPGEMKAQPQNSPKSAPASRFSDHRPDVVGRASRLPIGASFAGGTHGFSAVKVGDEGLWVFHGDPCSSLARLQVLTFGLGCKMWRIRSGTQASEFEPQETRESGPGGTGPQGRLLLGHLVDKRETQEVQWFT